MYPPSFVVLRIEFYRKRLRVHNSATVGLPSTFDPGQPQQHQPCLPACLPACMSTAGCVTYCMSAIYRAIPHTGGECMMVMMMMMMGLLTDSPLCRLRAHLAHTSCLATHSLSGYGAQTLFSDKQNFMVDSQHAKTQAISSLECFS